MRSGRPKQICCATASARSGASCRASPSSTGAPPGFTLFFPNYSTWEGRAGLYLEDIFVAEWARGHGVGRKLMEDLAAIAVARGWSRFDFSVLEWNPAREFYHALGFAHRAGMAALSDERGGAAELRRAAAGRVRPSPSRRLGTSASEATRFRPLRLAW